MEFTFAAYESLINKLKNNGYQIINYSEAKNVHGKTAILRHDVDYDLEKASIFAEFEKKLEIKSTYFILLTSDFYNINSKKSIEQIQKIFNCGHELGLHFDETRYLGGSLEEQILNETVIMEKILDSIPIRSVSMHRPSPQILNRQLNLNGLINSYAEFYFRQYKYVSDSRMRWREDIFELIENEQFEQLHILTHPFWYHKSPKTMREVILAFLSQASESRYHCLNENFSGLSEIIKEGELL